jgi:hypothetical protein
MKRPVTVATMRQHVETLIADRVPWDTTVLRLDGIRGARTLWWPESRDLLDALRKQTISTRPMQIFSAWVAVPLLS